MVVTFSESVTPGPKSTQVAVHYLQYKGDMYHNRSGHTHTYIYICTIHTHTRVYTFRYILHICIYMYIYISQQVLSTEATLKAFLLASKNITAASLILYCANMFLIIYTHKKYQKKNVSRDLSYPTL